MAVKDKLLRAYNPTSIKTTTQTNEEESTIVSDKCDKPAIFLPDDFDIRPYQEEAISNWAENGYRGIYDMATGTGKTLTALASIERLFRDNNNRLAVIIICPYQHLVEQWVEDIVRFGMQPIIGYSSSPQRNWKAHLKQAVRSFNMKVSDHFCLVTTIDSMKTAAVYSEISSLSDDTVFVVDEAHNAGAISTRRYLPLSIRYRLGLSATIDRYNDDTGTDALKAYFGEKCITYSLRDAIESGMLTPYHYHPVVVYFDEDELQEYISLTTQIAQKMSASKKKKELSEAVKQLLIKRSRIIAGARNKIPKLEEVMLPHRSESFQLVYCGATKDDNTGVDQISTVADMLGNKLNMRVGRFTAMESAQERMQIRELFSGGKQLQALVAIKCLDEGVNIPSIKNAYILASSTNPKEYIQRRGRVLRKFEGKTYAEIFDFITLPFPYEQLGMIHPDIVNGSKGLIKRELVRMMDFAEIADNPSEANELIMALKHGFNILDSDLKISGGDENVI